MCFKRLFIVCLEFHTLYWLLIFVSGPTFRHLGHITRWVYLHVIDASPNQVTHRILQRFAHEKNRKGVQSEANSSCSVFFPFVVFYSCPFCVKSAAVHKMFAWDNQVSRPQILTKWRRVVSLLRFIDADMHLTDSSDIARGKLNKFWLIDRWVVLKWVVVKELFSVLSLGWLALRSILLEIGGIVFWLSGGGWCLLMRVQFLWNVLF